MVIQLLAGLMMILIGAELFTNSVEWLGSRLNLPEGSVLHIPAGSQITQLAMDIVRVRRIQVVRD